MQKSLWSEDDRRLQQTENGHDEVRWVHLHPWHSHEAVRGISMHPAVLMRISDFEIKMYSVSAFAPDRFSYGLKPLYHGIFSENGHGMSGQKYP